MNYTEHLVAVCVCRLVSFYICQKTSQQRLWKVDVFLCVNNCTSMNQMAVLSHARRNVLCFRTAGSSLWWIFSGTCSSQTSLSCSFRSARLTRAVTAGSIYYGCRWELGVCMCGGFMMSAFMMKENMAQGFHPSRLIITKSLNSSLQFSGSFPREDWFSP